MRARLNRLRLRQMDDKLRPWLNRPKNHPAGGWLRAIRQTIGMTSTQLGRRLGITRQAVADLERREADGGVTIAALQRAADAMDCDLVYAIVPRQPLSTMVEQQARSRAAEKVGRIAHTMRLEAQEVAPEETERLVAESAETMLRENLRHLWD